MSTVSWHTAKGIATTHHIDETIKWQKVAIMATIQEDQKQILFPCGDKWSKQDIDHVDVYIGLGRLSLRICPMTVPLKAPM